MQWITNGKVLSRRSRKDATSKIYVVPPIPRRLASDKLSDAPSHRSLPPGPQLKSVADYRLPLIDNVTEELVYPSSTIGASSTDFELGTLIQEVISKQAPDSRHVHDIFRKGGRTRIKEILVKGLHDEAVKLLRTEWQPMKRLEHMLKFMQSEDLPNYDILSNETSDAVQAIQYCESQFHLSTT